jgi:sodium transport system permease protein
MGIFFKEIQTYLSTVVIISLIAAYRPQRYSYRVFKIPITNYICIFKQMIAGIINYQHITVTLSWSIIYILVSLFWSRYMVTKQSVIFIT